MDPRYVAVFLIDFIKLVLVFKLIFGFKLRPEGERYFLAVFIVFVYIMALFTLKNSNDRGFIDVMTQITLMICIIHGRIQVLGGLTILLHFLLNIFDSICMGIILIFCNGQRSIVVTRVNFDLLYTTLGLIVVVLLAWMFYPKRIEINEQLNSFKLMNFCYYFFHILVAQVIIGYTKVAVMDAAIIYSVSAALEITASFFGILIVASGIMINVLLLQKKRLNHLLYENAGCMEEQTKQYLLLQKKDMEMRSFRHDYNAHMLALHSLSEENNFDGIRQYIENLEMTQKFTNHIFTNNIIGDAVINTYYEKGISDGIEVKVMGNFPDSMNISLTDLCVILSNTVKNAYEATKKCGDNRSLSICIERYKDKAFITIKNPATEKPVIINGLIQTTKENQQSHGFGLGNVQEAIERNNAQFSMNYCEGYIIVDIQL